MNASKTYRYRYNFVLDEDGRTVLLAPAWPEVAADGASVAEALDDLRGAIAAAALGRIGRGEEIPRSDVDSGGHLISVAIPVDC